MIKVIVTVVVATGLAIGMFVLALDAFFKLLAL